MMADKSLSAAKAVLLAVQLATKGDISTLRSLTATYPKALRIETTLRILLTYLPETLETSVYVSFLQDLVSGNLSPSSNIDVDSGSLEGVTDAEASKKVRKLHLIQLAWPNAPLDAPQDFLTLFLIHRAYRIDRATGLLTQLPSLINPFLERSQYLRTWMISTLLPLLRLNYEYHPHEGAPISLSDFESMGDEEGVVFLLSRTAKVADNDIDTQKTIGRDLRGLVGPWMYGDTRWKRRRLQSTSASDFQTVAPLDQIPLEQDHERAGWEETFRWITSKASTSWITSVEAIEQWDGPGDVDTGGYSDGTVQLGEQEQQRLEQQYARTALATAYLIPEPSPEALEGVQRILSRMATLLDYDDIPSLADAVKQLPTIPPLLEDGLLAPENTSFLRARMLEFQNILTAPNAASIALLHGLLISAFIMSRAGVPCSIRRAGELVLEQKLTEQMLELQRLLRRFDEGPKGDDKYWIRARNELLWLRDWNKDLDSDAAGRGVFGRISKETLEMEVLKVLLSNTRYTLARSLYEDSHPKLLSENQVQDTIVSAALHAYDNASNANRTRGGVKKCDDIMHAFPETIKRTLARDRLDHLLIATHMISQYRLVLKQGQPSKPVDLRVHTDPISLIGKILEQNPKTYTKISEVIQIGEHLVKSGLTVGDVEGRNVISPEDEAENLTEAKRRITGLCIDAALAEDDFETAYSYVMNRLSALSLPAQDRAPSLDRSDSGIFATPPALSIDDWSWRAALQAGKYRMNSKTIRPTHVGNASGNLEIRHLNQQMECLSQCLRIAPPSTLHRILSVYRRCEEELDTKLIQEAEQEAAWDAQADETHIPGAFGADPKPTTLSRSNGPAARSGEEAPMSLFDLTRASATRAQNSLSQLGVLKSGTSSPNGRGKAVPAMKIVSENTDSGRASGESDRSDGNAPRTRKRDQLREAAVGTLASGIGWLINAPQPPSSNASSHDGVHSP